MPRLSKAEIETLFPYETFPIRMEWMEGKTKKIAWFQCHEHMQKQYDKVKKPRLKIDVRYRYPELKPEAKRATATKRAPAAKKTTTKAKAPVKRTRKKKASS